MEEVTQARTLFNAKVSELVMGKEFSLGDVLTITTGRLLSERHIDGVYAILNWMTGDNLFTQQLPRAANACKPWLIEQYPQLDPDQNSDLQFKLMELTVLLDNMESASRDKEDINYLIIGWLSRLGSSWGLSSNDKLEVFPLAASWDHPYESKHPIQEAVDMIGADRVICTQASSSDEIEQTFLE